MGRSLCIALAVCALLLSAAAPAAAQEVADEQARTQAMPLFNQGIALVSEHRWAEALDQFLEAFELFESPTILFNIGFCQRALGQYVEALDTFRRFADLSLRGVAATRLEEAQGYLNELESRVAHLTIEVPADQREGLELSVDGRSVELPSSGELARQVDPGRHSVQGRRDGFQTFFVDHDLRPGQRERVTVRLDPLPARLQISSNVEEAEVRLDGEGIGTVPFDAEIPPGRHRLEVRAAEYVPHRAIFRVASGETSRVRAYLSEEPEAISSQWWFWTGIVAVVAGAAVATYALTRPEPEPPPYEGGTLDWVIGSE